MWTPIILALFLSMFGLVSLFGINPQLALNQLTYFSIGLGGYFLVKKIGWSFFRNNATLFYWLFNILLVVTFIIGLEVKGSKRWIDLYFFNFQSSEFFKVFFVLFFADYFAKNKKNSDEPMIFLKSLFYFIIPALIIFKQPDLGNALAYVFIFCVMLFFSKVPKKTILYSLATLVIFLPLSWFFLKEYQKARIISFVNPHIDSAGSGYNAIQAMITVGSGKFFGKGLGYGTQTKLFFLPESHTDFAFSSLVEQLGFFGGFIVIFLFLLLVINLIKKVVKYNQDSDEQSFFKFLLVLGLLSYLVFQVITNIGMNLGLLPVAGVALPFISYGGSAVVGFLLGLALLP